MPAENSQSATALAVENAELKAEIGVLKKAMDALRTEAAVLKEQVADLLARLGKNSRNSSKHCPPNALPSRR